MVDIVIPNLSTADKSNYLINWSSFLQKADNFIIQFLNTQNIQYIVNAIQEYETILSCVDITDYLLIGSENKYIPKNTYIDCYYKLGTFYKTLAEKLITDKKQKNTNYVLEENEEQVFRRGIFCFITVRRVDFEHSASITQLMSIYSQLCYYTQHDLMKALSYLTEALVFSPQNTNINYNLGFVYQKLNKLELSLTHYKLAIYTNTYSVTDVTERTFNFINCYNGISSIYRSIKQWPESLHYLLKAKDVDENEPNINNQLGVVYTEMRRTDLAELHYKKAIENYEKSLIPVNSKDLLAEIYLNMGHMFSYNGDNNGSIDCYNKALEICPKFILAFQNKIFNLCYLYHQLDDKKYVSQQHKKINVLYKALGYNQYKYTFDDLKRNLKSNCKINVGIISGDFIDHPVSFFIKTFLTDYNPEVFDVFCYSECIIDTGILNSKLKFKFIRHKTTKEVCDMIYNDKIHILLDLSGHTAFNRMDVFYVKPAPIQISYIGYPYTTGISNMDYRITDSICDNEESQKFYSEKLIYFKNCFLCYTPYNQKMKNVNELPKLSDLQPYLTNGYLTFGCFNRLNKINDSVIDLFNRILLRYPTCKFIFKTKAILNYNISEKFLNKFDKSVVDRITLLDCTILHEQHLSEYNKIDISIDTFPYSGTTTSCESLLMGVPVLTYYDNVNYYHPQNVTASILKNSNLENYIYTNTNDDGNKNSIFSKIDNLLNDVTVWKKFKTNIRYSFMNGKVCDTKEYMKNFENTIFDLIKKI